MARQIYRKEALERLSTPEQLDQLMRLTSPQAWIALVGLGLLLLMALVWGFFGTISNVVEGQGVLLRRGGIKTIEGSSPGIVTSIDLNSGAEVAAGQVLLRLDPATPGAAKPAPIVSPFRARILEWIARRGDPVEKGTPLLILEPIDEPLRVRLYIPATEGYQIKPEMKVHVWPAHAKKGEFGYLLGTVRDAAKFPITQADMLRRVQNEDLARQLAQAGPCLQVVVELTEDNSTASGYKWSSSRGASQLLYSGTPCQAQVIVTEQAPLNLVFPGMRNR
jgi:HlyD family secretion protein